MQVFPGQINRVAKQYLYAIKLLSIIYINTSESVVKISILENGKNDNSQTIHVRFLSHVEMYTYY